MWGALMLQWVVSAAVVSTLVIPVALSAASLPMPTGTGAIVRPRPSDFVEVDGLNDIDADFEDAVLEIAQTW
jgi:hypothetical protein